MFSAAKLAIILIVFCFQDNQIIKKLILKGCNKTISYVTMFFQHKTQCEETNETIFLTCCKNPNFKQVVLNL